MLLVRGFAEARESSVVLYTPPAWMRHVTFLFMLPVFPLILAAYFPGRIKAAMKHPMLAAVKFWAFAHLLSNGSLADVLLFGGFLAWAVLDRISLKRRPPQRIATAPARPFNDVLAVVRGSWALCVLHRMGARCGCSESLRLGSARRLALGLELPTYADVQTAARRLKGHAHRTPVLTSHGLDEALGASVFFKCENFQRVGAFKFRGAFNALSCLPR